MMNNMIKLRGAKSRYLALLPAFILAFTLTAKAQVKTSEQEKESVKASIVYPNVIKFGTKSNMPDPLVLVEGELYEDWKNIDLSIIKSLTVYKADSDTAALYGAAKSGLIMIQLQEGNKQKPYKRMKGSSEEANEHAIQTIGDMPYTEDMLFVYDGNIVNLSDIKDLVPSECGINSMSLYHDGYYVDQYIDKYPKAKNGVVIINSYIPKDALWVIDEEPMTSQTFRERYPIGVKNIKYRQMHKDAETIAKYSQFPESKNGVSIVITEKNDTQDIEEI